LREVLKSGRPGETYNIGGRSERSNIDVVRTICATLDQLRPRSGGHPYAALITHVTDRPGHDRRYAIDDSKIAAEIGWAPKVAFEDGIRQTIAWYLDHPDWVLAITSGSYSQPPAAVGHAPALAAA
jgi:dTDP-glucose 4,6-dehydratase